MSAKKIIRAIEIVLVLGSFGLGAGVAQAVLTSGTNTVAETQLSSKFLEEGMHVAGGKSLSHSTAKKTAPVEKRPVITAAGAAR